MLLVCKNHIKKGIRCLNTPHIAHIGEKALKLSCVFCKNGAEYKLFYSIPISKSHRVYFREQMKKESL